MPDARVLKPASLDLRFPTQLSLGPAWTGAHAAALQAEVRQRLTTVPARLVVVDERASLKLSCSTEAPAPDEKTQSTETTCTDNSGAAPVRYACFLSKRHVQVSLEVKVLLEDRGQEVFRTSLPFSTQTSTEATIPKERVAPGTTPAAPPIDVGKLYTELVQQAALHLIKLVAPSSELLGKARSNCGPKCEDAWRLIAACDYAAADAKFEQARKSVDDPTQQSAALWGRAISHELLGRFDQARTFLEQGQELAPLHTEFATELAGLPARRAEAEQAEKQNLTRYTACSK